MTQDCWLWTGVVGNSGYASTYSEGRRAGVHRLVYEVFWGPIPVGLELDHLCRNRRCYNPWHLEPVTHAENMRRGDSAWGINARKTHCIRGHPLAGENLVLRRNGARRCRICIAADQKRWKAKRKGALVGY